MPTALGAVQMPYIRGSEPPAGASVVAAETPATGEAVMDWVKGWLN
jgi:penicillin-binding protein 1B